MLSSATRSGEVGKLSRGGVLMEKFPTAITRNCVGRSRKLISSIALPLPPTTPPACLLRLVRLSGRVVDVVRTVEHIWVWEKEEYNNMVVMLLSVCTSTCNKSVITPFSLLNTCGAILCKHLLMIVTMPWVVPVLSGELNWGGGVGWVWYSHHQVWRGTVTVAIHMSHSSVTIYEQQYRLTKTFYVAVPIKHNCLSICSWFPQYPVCIWRDCGDKACVLFNLGGYLRIASKHVFLPQQ